MPRGSGFGGVSVGLPRRRGGGLFGLRSGFLALSGRTRAGFTVRGATRSFTFLGERNTGGAAATRRFFTFGFAFFGFAAMFVFEAELGSARACVSRAVRLEAGRGVGDT